MKPHMHGHCIVPTDPETLAHVGERECVFEYDNYCEDPTCEIDGLDTIPVIAENFREPYVLDDGDPVRDETYAPSNHVRRA